ncbi:BREX-1 system adenine-specific DNA-methyltransferase PglX [Vibrio alginolyticus]|uniref:BREX-1 system adenine-specific DNA-methyltransferase PglX n=1 Tax=Vibrio TaxID=662 RepID=UPI001CDC1754|nr:MULTISPECIES: BREX-1 system adenine-specific DNA-methyltransferase PglX [Vibrio]MCA2450717.1 BREX-1 system adenine-specific DNA-methyltransferase PglX [Vibrio alginolyticus]MCA2474113.1 BREX-1 system adenine-specific DNA-methyltransferase PglX [Vibrio alginolyticus]MDW2154139.1 BREX-1 system adenine-specific DNA-methyltransferase PglX [Vibrio sp. 2092]MDW2230723.1 BREX-1 system adenine-specific DNA-methyltransferase PglX [Vibrio sp. 2091]
MNTNKLKTYAPKARLAFMDAVKKRAAVLGIYENKISEATTQGTDTLIEGRIFTRKQGQQRQQLVKRIEALGGGKDGYNQFINEMAFTWFNRFTAIRFMEVNGYLDHGFRMLSKEEGSEFGQGFEILAHAADVAEDLGLNKSDIVEMLLAGDKEEELYRELLLAQCHQLSKIMPFMFEKLDDATELLLPDNLTKTDSILKELVNDVPEDNWREIEVIGWLYQFYISEHKDAVIGKVVKKEDIPAATQLFTPNWIVKYLVQNSLGRQWLATYPDSELKDKMEYYISPAEQSDEVIEQLKAITPTSIDPEQIKVLDPACGSGHILVEVYEVLREIYLERGYRLREIPELILTKNIYGLDIDDRAAQMAAFAVLMKAREDDRRIFSRVVDNHIQLNIHAIQSTENLDINKLWVDLDLDGNKQTGSMGDLFAEESDFVETSKENQKFFDLVHYLKVQFIDGKNLGSLIKIEAKYLEPLADLIKKLIDKALTKEPTASQAANELLPVAEQALVLANQYDVVVANPPYIGTKGMNSELKKFARNTFPDSKSDLFAIYIERCINYGKENAEIGMVTPYVWMFISSYEKLRDKILFNHTIADLIQLEYNAFAPACIPVCTFTIKKAHIHNYNGSYIRLSDFRGADNQPIKTSEAISNPSCGWFYTFKPVDFCKIPGSPIAYWLPNAIKDAFKSSSNIDTLSDFTGSQNITGDNNKYLRRFWEIEQSKLGSEWIIYSKGGSYRKWYGNFEYVVDWSDKGKKFYKTNPTSNLLNEKYWFREGICYSDLTSGDYSARYFPEGCIYDKKGPAFHVSGQNLKTIQAILNTPIGTYIFKALNPTLTLQVREVKSFPILEFNTDETSKIIDNQTLLVNETKKDWDSFETSFEFNKNPIINKTHRTLEESFSFYKKNTETTLDKCKVAEEENNKIIISKYSLETTLDYKVNKKQITLTTNPHYRYSTSKIKDELELHSRFQSDAISELLSYSLGCMMGRYSLDREGLVYAHSGSQGFKELVAEGAYKTFPADDDGIIPLAAEDWLFEDDATSRFRDFVKTVWGEDHQQENLDFVAESLCLDAIKPKKNESSMETIRRYFSTQFYKDHLKTYKKRPIYWLFSSGKEKAFECLVYLHRYNESTLARMRTEYVTPLMGKLETQHSVLTESRTNASSTEQRRIDKELKSIEKKQSELRAFDEELKHLAEMKISIDLDDGVKVNYGKFGNLLADVKAIHGKKPEELK